MKARATAISFFLSLIQKFGRDRSTARALRTKAQKEKLVFFTLSPFHSKPTGLIIFLN